MIYVDALGAACPIPVVKAKKALDHAVVGEVLEIHVDNEIAVHNLRKMAQNQQYGFQSEKADEKHFVVKMIKGQGTIPEAASVRNTHQEGCQLDICNHSVVIISAAVMGAGNDELGKVLMKGFIYALTQLEQLPEKIIFYNGGVIWTTKGSDALEDLKMMEAEGVTIMSCGTCLDFYQLTDKLGVGEISNMYDIAAALASASKVIRP